MLSREIPATAQLLFTTEQAATLVLWDSLPLDFQKTPVQLQCDYVDDTDQPQSLNVTVDPSDSKVNFDERVSRSKR